MTVSDSAQIPKPADPIGFQRKCKVLFERVLNDPNVEEWGSSGHAQKGVDLLGRRRDEAPDHWVGIQCKLVIKASRLSSTVVREEAVKALSFRPKLKEYIIATTSPNHPTLQAEAAAFTDEQAKLGRDFTVQVWGWDTLVTHICRHDAALKEFFPDGLPHIGALAKSQERLIESAETYNALQIEILGKVRRIEQRLTASESATSTVWDDSAVGTILDNQINQYREMLKNGQPRTALRLLETLWNDLLPGADDRIRFRVKANMAACKMRLGDEKAAAADWIESYSYAPNDAKAIAFKVLGLVILGDAAKAWESGLASIGVAGDRSALIAHLITTARFLPEINNALTIVPPDLKFNPAIEVATVDFLRFRPEHGNWIQAAREAKTRHPDDKKLKLLGAEAEIADACTWSDANARAILPPDTRKLIVEATRILQAEWSNVVRSEAPGGNVVVPLCSALSTSYRLLHDTDAAKKIIAEGVSLVPDNHILIEQQFIIAIEGSDAETANQLVDRIPPSRDAIFGRLQLAANADNWAAIVALAETAEISGVGDEDRANFESLTLLARCRLGHVDDPRKAVSDLLKKYEREAIVPIVLYEVARLSKDDLWADELFQTAYSRSASLNWASRLMLARIAAQKDYAEVVIDLLDGQIDINRDSEELRSLARAFVNAKPRPATLQFIRLLPDELKVTPFYGRVVGSLHFNSGALQEAASAFQEVIKATPNDLGAHLGIINTWRRQDRQDLVESHVRQIDPFRLEGSDAQKVELAQILVAFGRPNDGLKLGYDTALNNRDNLQVAQLYIGLILPNPTAGLIPSIGPEVQVDCWIRLVGDDDQTRCVVIEEGPDRPAIDHYGPQQPFARAILGHRRGDVISLTPARGTAESWRITEIKHKALALLHDIMRTLHSRFPGARSYYKYEVKGGNLKPVLEEVRNLSQRAAYILKLYLEQGFPLALAAAFHGKCSIDFAGYVTGQDELVRACIGTPEERRDAAREIRAAVDRGIVLDTYTAWVAHSLDVIPVLKAVFSRVVVARSTVDELRRWRDSYQPTAGGEPGMKVFYQDGRYFRDEISVERLARTFDIIDSGVRRIEGELEVLPAFAPAAPSKMEATLHEIGYGILDPVYIALSGNLLLLSDDLHFRNLARNEYQRVGVWLQAVLMHAAGSGSMSAAAYAHAVGGLTALKHSHIALNYAVLAEILTADDTEGIFKFRAAAEFIGTQSADFESHLKVSWEFLENVFELESRVPYLRRAAAAGALLERLVPMLNRHGLLRSGYRRLIRESGRVPLLREYLIDWSRGHFLNLV